MTAEDLQRFAEDLRLIAGAKVELQLSSEPNGLHIIRINGVDFFFHANGSGYDGWGRVLVKNFPL